MSLSLATGTKSMTVLALSGLRGIMGEILA
jgi:hypothetical protein